MSYPIPNLSLSDGNIRKIWNWIRSAMTGKLNNTGSVTLTNSATTTTVSDSRIGEDTAVFLTPTTVDAGSENYHITVTDGQFVITHSNATTTRTFDYALLG